MTSTLIAKPEGRAVPVRVVMEGEVPGDLAAWAAANGFRGKAGELLPVAGQDGAVEAVLFGGGKTFDPWTARQLAVRLPSGDYSLEGVTGEDGRIAATAFALGGYRFDRYKPAKDEPEPPRLVCPEGVDLADVQRLIGAATLSRQMVDTPPNDMGPAQIESIVREIAESNDAEVEVTIGDALLENNFPAVHAVGRAAAPHRAPRLIELSWNMQAADRPLIALVGNGVCFDSGGLDLKSAAGMRLMKKDMGGSAHALALARLIMESKLNVRLKLLISAVENAVSGDAFRPGDIVPTRKGLTIEVGNTDAEGRVILSDALARAGEHSPDLTVDFATLTGAARIALGPELAPFYTDDDGLAADLMAAGATERDPMWRMPLWPGYKAAIETEIADVRNDSAEWAQGGSITAALFLQKFAPETGTWVHMDIMGWNPRARPGWPVGAETQSLRTWWSVIKARYGG